MRKLKAEIHLWGDAHLYSIYMGIGHRGNLETTNYKSKVYAKRAFVAMCNQLGISKDKYEFIDKTGEK